MTIPDAAPPQHKLPLHVTMQPVASSNIAGIGYDPDASHLYVDFGTRETPKVYRYEGVAPEKHAALMAADSKGSHFASQIRSSHTNRRVAADPWQPKPQA